MPLSKKQLQRLLRLVALLKENRYPNCTSFANTLRKADLDENVNLVCTEKTVYRDIQTLKNDFDAPILFSKSRNGYYLSRHNWVFSCPQIYDDNEMLAAVLGARVAEHIFPTVMQKQIRDAVDYLLTNHNPAFLQTAQVDSLVVIPSNRVRIDATVFMPLFYAWQNREICHVVYRDSKDNATERDFAPHALIFFDGVWYTKGFCYERKDLRTLVLPRIKSAVPTGKHFEPDPKIVQSATEDELFDPEIVADVLVVCDEYLANIILTRPLHIEQTIISLPDGRCEINVKSMSKYRLVTWIMRQCGRATVKKPLDVAAEIAGYASNVKKNHDFVLI